MPCPVNHPFLDPRTLPGALAYAAGFVVLAAIGIRLVRVLARRASRHFPDPTASTFLAQFAQPSCSRSSFSTPTSFRPSGRWAPRS